MTSTRNKNDIGNYTLEQLQNHNTFNFNTNSIYGFQNNTYLPSNGLLQGKIGSNVLSNNACDIESMLRGIRSTDLVNSPFEVNPDIKKLKSLSIVNHNPIIIPKPFVVDPNQRPLHN